MTNALTNYPREELFVVDAKGKDFNAKKNVSAGLVSSETLEVIYSELCKTLFVDV